MEAIKITPKDYLKKIELGYFEPIECVSLFIKKVKHNLCGRSEIILVDLK